MMPQHHPQTKTDKQFTHFPPGGGSLIPLKGDKNQISATVALNEFTHLTQESSAVEFNNLGQAFQTCQTGNPSLEVIGERVKWYITLGKSLAVDTAVYLSDARERHFKKTGDWMNWAQDVTDYDSRYLYMLLSVGDMLRHLGEVYYLKHKDTDIVRLEIAASITDERKQKAFLTRTDFLTLSRDELRAEAAKLRGIAGREEHAARVAKKSCEHLDFFGVLDGAAAQTFSHEELTTAAAKVEPLTLLKASQSVLSLFDEAATIGRFANVSQATRKGFAAALREAAAKLDY